MALGCFLLSTFDDKLTLTGYILKIIPYGIGVGMFQSPNNSSIMGSAPPGKLGVASGLLSLSRILGQTLGIPIVSATFAELTLNHPQLTEMIDISHAPISALIFGTQITFRIIAFLLLITIIVVGCSFCLEQNQPQKTLESQEIPNFQG
jgi:fucose permease